MKVALGYDSHKLIKSDKEMIVGGVKIKTGFVPLSHSDGDVIVHSLIDCLAPHFLKKDIGELYSNTDKSQVGASSINRLKEVFKLSLSPSIINIDIVFQSDDVIISPIKSKIQTELASVLNMKADNITIKGKTTEGLIKEPCIQVWSVMLYNDGGL